MTAAEWSAALASAEPITGWRLSWCRARRGSMGR